MARQRGSWGEALRLSTVGITLVLCIVIGTGIGIWLDERWGSQPAATVVGFFLGVAAGFMELVRAVRER